MDATKDATLKKRKKEIKLKPGYCVSNKELLSFFYPAMSDHNITVIIAASVGSIGALVIVLILCFYCYRRKLDESFDSADYYVSVPREEGQPERSDVKQLRRHSWKERADARTMSPFLTRKTIK